MDDYDSYTRRRTMVPSTFQASAKLVNVTPSAESHVTVFDHSQLSNFRSFPNDSSVAYPILEETSPSLTNSDISHVADLFTFKIGQHIQGISIMDKLPLDLTENGESHTDSFFSSMRPFMCLAQVFAFMPVSGINGHNHKQIQFRWLHWKLLCTLVTLGGVTFLFICNLLMSIRESFSYAQSAPLAFYGTGIVGYILFLDLARKWRDLNEKFAITENILKDHTYPKGQRRKFLTVTILFGVSALIEHILAFTLGIVRTVLCTDDSKGLEKTIQLYFLTQYSRVFDLVDYHITLAIYVFMSNLLCTICWNFMDLFLGLMGMSLSSRLRQINEALRSVHGQGKSTLYWRKIREEFNAVSVLIKAVDSDIQKLMLLSVGNNLFFICLQLLMSLQKRVSFHQIMYFVWSFGFLISRMCFVMMCGAGVYDESRESKTVLFSVPHHSFCYEVRRFLTQLTTDELALTGCRFFSVTRGLILTIAGTVVTYEIVLLQFKTGNDTEDWPVEGNKTHCAVLP